MRAQQVVDLTTPVTASPKSCPCSKKIQANSGMTDGTKGLYNTAQISVAVVGSTLKIYGAQQLIADGYVPYLFPAHTKAQPVGRQARNRGRRRHQEILRQTQGVEPLRLRPLRQNIRLYALFLNQPQNRANNRRHRLLDLARCPRHRPYTPRRLPSIGWGRSTISLLDPKNPKKHRMIRLRFAVGFAKKMLPGRSLITTANLASSLAEFSIIYNPTQKWTLGSRNKEIAKRGLANTNFQSQIPNSLS